MRALAALFIILGISGCVTGGSEVQIELNSLKHSSIQYRKDIAVLKEEVKHLKEAQATTLANADIIDALRSSQTSLYTKVSSMTADVQSTTATLDEIQYSTRQTLEAMGAELDLVKAKSEGNAGTGMDKLGARIAAIEGTLGILKTQLASLSDSSAAEASQKSLPDALYKKAYEKFEARRYTEARQSMQEFLDEYPKHKLAGNALFWIGETHFNQKRYDSAILAYQDVIDKHPGNNKVPAANLKQAYAFIELGEKVAAKGILKTLISRYPKSDMVKPAKRKLRELK
jgi:tol-pal system protein YbgF